MKILGFLGAIIGRVAGRIQEASFTSKIKRIP